MMKTKMMDTVKKEKVTGERKEKTFEKQKTVIVIEGPTAVGKTALSLQLARHFNTAVISADSRQCYREMSIGTAKPTPGELKEIKHYFINSHAITEEVNAGIFEKLALEYADEIFSRNNIAILCGGSGLYIKAFCEGMDEMLPIPEGIRKQVRKFYIVHGIEGLHKELELKDPAFLKTAELWNPHRLMRALEVREATGQSILAFRKNKKKTRDFHIVKTGLTVSKERLWDNIIHRTYHMISEGLVDEVRELLPYRDRNALQTVGYMEIFDYLDKKSPLNEAIKKISIHTRQYAKRQMTWFRKDEGIRWFKPEEYKNILYYIKKETANFV